MQQTAADKPHLWRPGQSGNPSGRRKTKPITSVILAALNKPMYPGDRRTMAQCFKDRLAQIIMTGEDGHSIAAFKMLLEYTEGKPQQKVTIDYERALDDIATRTGAPRMWLVKRAEEITLRHALEGQREDDDDGQSDGPVYPPADTYRQPGSGKRRIDGVRKERRAI